MNGKQALDILIDDVLYTAENLLREDRQSGGGLQLLDIVKVYRDRAGITSGRNSECLDLLIRDYQK